MVTEKIMENAESNGDGKLVLGAALIGGAGIGLGVLGKVVIDKVRTKMAEKAADAAPESEPETTK